MDALTSPLTELEQAFLELYRKEHPIFSDLNIEDIILYVLYEQLPADARAEIVDGHIVVYSPAMPEQTALQSLLMAKMQAHVEANQLGGAVFSASVIVRVPGWRKGRQPDLMWVPEEELPQLESALFKGVPGLIIEILAKEPKNQRVDLEDKPSEYSKLGVPEYWILNPYDPSSSQFGVLWEHGYVWEEWVVGLETYYESQILPGFRVEQEWVAADYRDVPHAIGLVEAQLRRTEELLQQEHQRAEDERQRTEKAEKELAQ